MKNTMKFALVGALLSTLAPVAIAAECHLVSKEVTKQLTSQPEQVLKIVAKQIAANKGCECEVVKVAIVATEANKKQVAQILEQAIEAAPQKASLLTTCALAVAPDAHNEVMKVSAKYANKNTGEGSVASETYSAKGGDFQGEGDGVGGPRIPSTSAFNPLNFIGGDNTGNFQQAFFNVPGQGGTAGQVDPGTTYSQ